MFHLIKLFFMLNHDINRMYKTEEPEQTVHTKEKVREKKCVFS